MDAEFLHLLTEVSSLLLEKLRPIFLGRVTKHLADGLELMHFGIALEERNSLLEQFGNDAANGPDIDCAAILPDLEQQFRGSVPEGDNFAC
jgi:hypothetical protein